MAVGTTVAPMPSIRDCGPQLALTIEKSCWKKGADRMTAADAITATRNRNERIRDCVSTPQGWEGLKRSHMDD